MKVTNERQAAWGFWNICNLGKVGSVTLNLQWVRKFRAREALRPRD